jgi:arginyl-tRNA--protein-N-Asp/Glu arginylyltransferase
LILTSCQSIEFTRPPNEFKDWSKLVKDLLRLFKEFDEVIVQQSKMTPTFFLNYEQLVTEPESTIKNLFAFLLGVDSIEGTLVAK